MEKIVQLSCPVKTYKWGKIGEASEVASLAERQSLDFKIDPEEPYAELWMGAHPQGMAKLIGNDTNSTLGQLIESNPDLLGNNIINKFGATLPYLFKVLSINKALSIQAHPTKDHAKRLHTLYPGKYPDPNHKPEMAIAITKFEALCGFRPLNEILDYFENIGELILLVGQEAYDKLKNAAENSSLVEDALKNCISNLMECDVNIIKTQATGLTGRLKESQCKGEDTTSCLGNLFLRIHDQFPGDVGCFMIYFLNYITLDPFESIFLGPNLAHAYLSGDIMECMACSDNVVRAGLTPKFKDVKTLIEMLNYTPQSVEEIKFHPEKIDDFESVYDPPVEDFTVRKVLIPSGSQSEYEFKETEGPSIFITIRGKCKMIGGSNADKSLNLSRGTVVFAGCNEIVTLKDIDKDELLIFQAYCV